MGAALPVVLFALAMSSALAVGGLYLARQLAASAVVAQHGAELEPAAEGVIAQAFARWDSAARAKQTVGSTEPLPSANGLVHVSGWVTRTSDYDYWIVAEAITIVKPLIRRRLGLLLHITKGRPAPIPARAWTELP